MTLRSDRACAARRWLPLAGIVAGALLWSSAAMPQEPRSDAALTLSQAEHLAAGLHPGMSTDEVRQLLGTPLQTSLKSDFGAAIRPSNGAMQWSYSWGVSTANGRLQVDFIAEELESYRVDAWHWTHN